jgi:phosphatidylglycerol lysyltransferase
VTLPRERELARRILQIYGRHAMDFFKIWPDKSLFFSSTERGFLAYRVGANFCVVLADPVGPEEEIERIVSEFIGFCEENDWRIAFHQTLPDFLPVYEKLGFRKFKIGDDAIVDLALFSIDGKKGGNFRRVVNRIESQGIRIRQMIPPISADDLEGVKEVSDEWLTIAGKRERGFTLGAFNREYIATTTIFAAVAPENRVLGFVNLIPSYRKGEMTSDLMRRRNNVPNGLMDYIFIELFLYLKEKGYERFNMGMAPMSGFREGEDATAEERAIHYFFQHIRFLFSFRGLKAYKAKFATAWEPRYIIYQNALDLPRHARAIYAVSELAFTLLPFPVSVEP